MAVTTKQKTPQFGLCIDWETSGSVWGGDSSKEYQGVSFGAIVFNTADFTPVEKLYIRIKFDDTKYKWSEDAEKIHGLSRAHLAEFGVTQSEAAITLAELILKYWGPDSKVMFMGHNAEFDRRFTNQLLNTIEIEFSVEKQTSFSSWIQLHHIVLDTSPIGFVNMGLFKSDLLFEAMGFPERAEHNALTDAEQTLETAKAMREIFALGITTLKQLNESL